MPADAPTEKRTRSRAKQDSRWKRFSLDNPIVASSVVLFFVAGMIAILAIDFQAPSPELTDEDVGTIAEKDFRAEKDFAYSRIDEEATERSREERASQVPAIYRWDVSSVETARRRIREAFAFMREEIAKIRQSHEASRAQLMPDPIMGLVPRTRSTGPRYGAVLGVTGLAASTHAPPQLPDTATPEPTVPRDVEANLNDWLQNHQHEFSSRLLEYVDDATYRLLAQRRFGEAIEHDLLELVESVLREQIIADLRQLEGATAIVIQKRRGDDHLEEWLERNLEAVADVQRAVKQVDEQARVRLAAWSPSEQAKFAALAKQFVKPNLDPDANATESARQRARDAVTSLVALQAFKKGQIIVDEGHQISEEHLEIYRTMRGDQEQHLAVWSVLGLTLFLGLVLGSVWVILRRDFERRKHHRRDLVFLGTTLLMMTAMVKIGEAVLSTVADAWQLDVGYLIIIMLPFAAGSLLLRLVIDSQVAIVFAVVLSLIVGLATDLAGVIVPYALTSGIVGAVAVKHAKTRMVVLRAGVIVGLVSAVCAAGLVMFQQNALEPWELLAVAGLALTSGILAAILVTVGLPIAETVFGFTTDIKLLELANLEHPGLKSLLLKAPGTYHHSMMVGSLNEAAADAIGANSLLARVGAYYHDLGKMKNPQYFAENQSDGDNPHNRLKPNMSALILKAHVKDGIELAKQYKLPQDIIDFIATHHGTSRIEYFFHKAKEQESPDIPEVREEDYRYPGPKPHSRETGICMISDTVEAAARSMPEKTPARLKMLVNKLVNHKFADGQFDECDLTLRDLNAIAEAMLHVLNAVYHQRPEYPAQKKERERRERVRRQKTNGAASEPAATVEKAVVATKAPATAASSEKGKTEKTEKSDQVDAANGAHQHSEVPLVALTTGPNPSAPVGRVRTDRSGSGEHSRLDFDALPQEEVPTKELLLETTPEFIEEITEEVADQETPAPTPKGRRSKGRRATDRGPTDINPKERN